MTEFSIKVSFYSYFKDLAGCAETTESLAAGTTIEGLLKTLSIRFPRLGAMQRSFLVAVGVDYQDRSYVLKEGDEVSLFPPVQGG
jgi:molybdopterin converting factor small subunit